jgi:hypothetical protein
VSNDGDKYIRWHKEVCGVYAKNLTAQIQKKTENNEKPCYK